MKLLVLSDSHGDVGTMIDFVEQVQPNEIVHLGDCISDAQSLSCVFPDIPMLMVPGNCDFCIGQPDTLSLERNGALLVMAHGHQWRVKSGPTAAVTYAQGLGADILLYGHTHKAACWQVDNLWVLNPGSAGGRGARASCGVIEIRRNSIHCEIRFG